MACVKTVSLAFAVALSAGFALADTIPDPFIKLGGGGGSGDIIVPNFIILSPTGTSPAQGEPPVGSPCTLKQFVNGEWLSEDETDCVFRNSIFPKRSIWQLTFDIFGVDAGGVNCYLDIEGSPFKQCSVSGDQSFTEVKFFDGIIPHGAEFSLVVGLFPANTNFYGTVAEPGTLALFLVGLAALLARRTSLTR